MNPDHREPEYQIAGLCVFYGEKFFETPEAQRIRPNHFTNRICREAWAAVQAMLGAGEQISPRQVQKRIQMRDHEISEWSTIITVAATMGHYRYWIEELLKVAACREIYSLCKNVVDNILTTEKPLKMAEGCMDSISQALINHHDDGERRHFKSAKEVALATLAHLEAISADDGAIGYRTGIGLLDRVVRFSEGTLNTICARPSVGKSALMLQAAVNIAKAAPVYMFSAEMTDVENGIRFLVSRTSINSNSIQAGERLTPKQMTEAQVAISVLASLNLFIRDCSQLTLGQLGHGIRQAARKGGKVIFIDYLGLIETAGKRDKRIELGDVTRTLKALAKRHGVAIVLLAQLNRHAEGKSDEIGLAHLAETDDVSRDSNVVLAIGADHNLHVVKNRGARTGKVIAAFDGGNQRFVTFASEAEKEKFSAP